MRAQVEALERNSTLCDFYGIGRYTKFFVVIHGQKTIVEGSTTPYGK
jgi:hypothetical protein